MIGYICKYTPIEILKSFGEEVTRIEPVVADFTKADALAHPNLCSYAKAVLEQCLQGKFERLILTNCCDSIKRINDLLQTKKQFDFLYFLDLPRKRSSAAIKLFTQNLINLIDAYQKFSGKTFCSDNLRQQLTNKQDKPQKTTADFKIGIMGARCPQFMIDLFEQRGITVKYNLTCTQDPVFISDEISQKENLLEWYACKLLNSYPCMRMENIKERYAILADPENSLAGFVHHTIKFCDFYSFDYANLKQKTKLPLLNIETDYTLQSKGQIRTRVEAFIESLRGTTVKNKGKKSGKIVAGIDSGSLSTNVVIMNHEKNVLSSSIVRTGAKSLDSAQKAYSEALKQAKLSPEAISYVVSTGYGRVSIPFAHKNVTEITCHGRGAHYLNNQIRTIIDIGGQDSKVIRLDENGEVIDFAMNDKCSAGTGRFLEVMARTLEIPLEKMGEESLSAQETISITSMCTVFAESEVVSLIAQNKNKAEIINGLHNSIAGKTVSMLERIGKKRGYMMTGGVAKNPGVVKWIETKLNEQVFVPEEPQIVGALGAALIALETV